MATVDGIQTKGEEEKKPGVVHRVTHHLAYHVLQSMLSYMALITMIAALTVLEYPPHFMPTVHKATSLKAGVPGSNELFDPLAASYEKTELEGTEYRYAFAFGKSAVRVCTDLAEDEFEKVTGLKQHLRKWDQMSLDAIQEFKENGCSNTSILAYNSACTPELGEHSNRGAYWWKKKGSIALPQSQGKDEKFPIRGACGTPGNNDQIFVSPDPGHGFLWTKMIRNEIKPMDFGPDQNISVKNCTTNTCEENKLCYDSSCLVATSQCQGFVETEIGCTSAVSGKASKTCDANIDLTKTHGYCECGGNEIVSTCELRDILPNDKTSVSCAEVCKCQTNRTTCAGQNERCSCDVEYKFIPGKPDWIINNPQFENSKCVYGFGPINADKEAWKGKTATACGRKYVHSYGRETTWIVILFTFAIFIRVMLQVCQIYWGCTEDDLRLKILFTTETFMRIFSLCKYGLKAVNDAIDNEHEQGWPWLIALIDSIFTSIATLGISYGADPFPETSKGRFTLLFLWISAIREIGKCLIKIKTSVQKKQWYVTKKSKHVECCGKTIRWCLVSYEEEEPAKA